MSKLVLFDIDKTLLKSSTGHKLTFSEAFKKVYGVDTNIGIINHHGMTDQQIIIEVLKKNGLNEKAIKARMKECMEVMARSYEKVSEKDEVVLLDGVKETLGALRKKGILLGLVTGNLEPIAWGKLKKVEIGSFFIAGGFGSDDINRTNLVILAIKRVEDKFNISLEDIFLVGDAPSDMKAGKEAKIKTVGVTTGIYAKEELEKAGADYCVASLEGLLEIV